MVLAMLGRESQAGQCASPAKVTAYRMSVVPSVWLRSRGSIREGPPMIRDARHLVKVPFPLCLHRYVFSGSGPGLGSIAHVPARPRVLVVSFFPLVPSGQGY
jgi:hypothetical protein